MIQSFKFRQCQPSLKTINNTIVVKTVASKLRKPSLVFFV